MSYVADAPQTKHPKSGSAEPAPEFPLQGKKVTIRHLLNHTSGIHS
jgi:CubicO group peptidase (beta-lactamase class C family)